MAAQRTLDAVNAYCLRRRGRLPDLANPQGYNDKIHWLKVHDQRPEHIIACDKWAVRDMVERIAGRDVLIPASRVFPPTRYPVVAKASHDSGSATFLSSAADIPVAEAKLRKRLAQTYGADKGEWAYQFVRPAIIVEDAIAEDPVDYKFHCVAGEVRWVQVIWNRRTGPTREAILSPEGKVLPLHMDERMQHVPSPMVYPGDRAWAALAALARQLSAKWRYVRVDLYWEMGRALFGELTFWPRAGFYRSRDEPKFGAMLDIDLAVRKPPIV